MKMTSRAEILGTKLPFSNYDLNITLIPKSEILSFLLTKKHNWQKTKNNDQILINLIFSDIINTFNKETVE